MDVYVPNLKKYILKFKKLKNGHCIKRKRAFFI